MSQRENNTERKRSYGVQVRDREVRRTPFVCPRCGLDREGAEVEPQRWFAIGPVPLIPLATLPRVIRCDVCWHRCDVEVLEVPTSDLLAAFLADALWHAVATIVRAGTEPGRDLDEEVVETAIETIVADGHADYDEERLRADVVGLDDVDTRTSLRRLVDELTPHGKQSFIHRLAAIALIDGPMTPRERRALVDMGIALGMPAPHINGVVAVAQLEPELT